MGAKDWIVFYAETEVPATLRSSPQLDRDATDRLVRDLFPHMDVAPAGDVTLESASPPDDEIYAAGPR
jgi:hypothetical protein